jgi:hypothetical protein
MALWDKLKQTLRAPLAKGRDEGIYFYVRCDRCGDRVRVRLNPMADLQQEFGDSGNQSGYSVRKMVVDQRCFRPIEVRMRFDDQRRERSREIQGGEFLTQEEYDAS